MKVISGTLKGRNIKGYNIEGTRPTMDRVKESLFGMIQDNIKNRIVLDLFAGSGSLGIEAISNNCKYCYFVDNNKEAIKVLKNNISDFNITNSKVLYNDYKDALNYLYNNNIKIDLIFIDPPYKFEIIEELIAIIIKYNLLNENALIIIESQNTKLLSNYNNLVLIKQKKYSDKYIHIYKNQLTFN